MPLESRCGRPQSDRRLRLPNRNEADDMVARRGGGPRAVLRRTRIETNPSPRGLPLKSAGCLTAQGDPARSCCATGPRSPMPNLLGLPCYGRGVIRSSGSRRGGRDSALHERKRPTRRLSDERSGRPMEVKGPGRVRAPLASLSVLAPRQQRAVTRQGRASNSAGTTAQAGVAMEVTSRRLTMRGGIRVCG